MSIQHLLPNAPDQSKRRRVRVLTLSLDSMTFLVLTFAMLAGLVSLNPAARTQQSVASMVKVYDDFWADYRSGPLDVELESRTNRL